MTAAEWAEAIATEAREAIGTRGGGDLAAVLARLEAAEEAWLWRDETEDMLEGYGYHMSQMLARLPCDSQTADMKMSIDWMLTDLRTLTADLAAARSALAACRQVAHERAEAGRGQS